MKKLSKIALVFAFMIISVFSLVACGTPGQKEFTSSAGLKITLTDEFYEKDLASQTMYLESKKVIFVALKEEFTNLSVVLTNPSSATKEQYAKAVQRNNHLSCEIINDQYNGLLYFTYEKSVSGKDFFYFAVIEKGSDAFWLCQFACAVSEKDNYTPTFIEYAKTIQVS